MLSIQEARQIIGEKSKQMTDKEVDEILILLRALSSKVIDQVIQNT